MFIIWGSNNAYFFDLQIIFQKVIVKEKNAKYAGIILRKGLDTIDLKTRQQQ